MAVGAYDYYRNPGGQMMDPYQQTFASQGYPQTSYNNPYAMQNALLQQQYAPWGGNPYNVGPSIVNQMNANNRWSDQMMPYRNQRQNFTDLLSALPRLLGSFSSGLTGSGLGGFHTDYGAGATWNQPQGGAGLSGLLGLFH